MRTFFCGLLAALALLGWRSSSALDMDKVPGEIKDVTIVVGDEPYTGTLIPPATDTDFRFKLSDTGDVITFRWSSLVKTERRRVQKIFGIEVEEGKLVFGEKMDCVRLKLKSGKSYEGLDIPDRALSGYRCLKTATQTVQIPKNDVESEEKVEKRESELYSALEVYERLLQEKPPLPDVAADHLDYARKCSNMGLYDKAIDHLKMAETIDPRVEERTKEFRGELIAKHADKQAEVLYLQILTDIHGGDNAGALAKIQRLKRNFPNSEYYTKVDGLQPEVEKGSKVDFAKNVIFMYYTLFSELIQERLAKRVRVDSKGRPVLAQPGKQVTTRQDKIFRGEIAEGGSADVIVLKQGDVSLEIPRKEVVSIVDIDLGKCFREVEPPFSELKTWVTDANGGLGKEIVTRISQTLHESEAKVRDVWASRFNQTQKYKDGVIEKTPLYTQLREATYAKGSWLRDGVQVVQVPGQQNQNGRQRNGRNGNNNGRNGGGGASGSQVQQPDQENPEISDDPDVWWNVQRPELKFNLLRALGSEKLFRVKQVSGDNCPTCAAKGIIEIWDSFGSLKYELCPTCRGLRLLTRIFYE